MLIGAGAFVPFTVIELDVCALDGATPVIGVNANASGVVSTATVVTLNGALTPPIVSVAVVVVFGFGDAVCRTTTVAPGGTVAAVDVNGPPLMLYSPPTMLIGAGAFVPFTVIELDVCALDSGAPVTGVKENAFGVVSTQDKAVEADAVLLPRFGSRYNAVSLKSTAADGCNVLAAHGAPPFAVPFTVNVTLPPTGSVSAAVLMFPVPLAGQLAPADPVHVHVRPVNAAGKLVVTVGAFAPLSAAGPVLVTTTL
jgi:hypothetical protein